MPRQQEEPKKYNPDHGAFFIVLDYILIPAIILFFIFDPNFKHGYIDHLEAGDYLSWVNGIFNGKIPYKDFVIIFGPFQLYSIAAAMSFFGKTLAVLRTYFYCGYMISFLLVYILARFVCRTRIFACIATFVCMLEVSHPFWASRWDFGRMGLGMLVFIFLALFVKRNNRKILFIAGIVSALTFFYSFDIGAYAIASAVMLLLTVQFASREKQLNLIAANSSIYIIGGLIVAVPFLIFLASQNALIPFITTYLYSIPKYLMKVWSHPISYVSVTYGVATGWRFITTELFKAYLPIALYAFIVIYLMSKIIKKTWDREKALILAITVYGVLAYKFSFRAIDGPQFQVALPTLIIATGFLMEKMYFKLKRNLFLCTRVAIILVFIVSAVYFLTSHKRYYGSFSGWLKYQSSKKDLVAIYTRPLTFNSMPLVKARLKKLGNIMIPQRQDFLMEETVRYLEANSKEHEEVFTFPEHGIYNFLANRPSFSRFFIAGFAWTTPEWRNELLGELRSKRPRLIVYSNNLSNMARSMGRQEELLPEVIDFIKTNYHPMHQIGDITFYEVNN